MPGLGAFSRFPAQQSPAVGTNPLRLVHRGKEFGPDGHVARRERAQFGVGEGEAGEKDVHEGLLNRGGGSVFFPTRHAYPSVEFDC